MNYVSISYVYVLAYKTVQTKQSLSVSLDRYIPLQVYTCIYAWWVTLEQIQYSLSNGTRKKKTKNKKQKFHTCLTL